MPTVAGTNIIILSDLMLWNTLGPTDRVSEFKHFNPEIPKIATRFLFRTVIIIVASIIKRIMTKVNCPENNSSAAERFG